MVLLEKFLWHFKHENSLLIVGKIFVIFHGLMILLSGAALVGSLLCSHPHVDFQITHILFNIKICQNGSQGSKVFQKIIIGSTNNFLLSIYSCFPIGCHFKCCNFMLIILVY